jgi:hypothetical protein
MTIDYNDGGRVKFTMFDYIKNMLDDLPADMDGEAATPAAPHLFQVNEENPEKLSEDRAQLYHHNVVKLLFLSRRARPDIQTAVAFLCTRVKAPGTDDYKKLARCMKYLRQSAFLPLILEGGMTNIVKWWVDGAYGAHNDMRSHTGAMMSLGKGAAYATSTRQKLNTRSSTEAELVGVDDVMALVVWTRYFLQAQGYTVDDNIVYQDNQSAMLLEKNGRRASGKRTRHINIRYFFVTDGIANGEMMVEYRPTGTEEMVGDFFTKALQGTLFKKFRNLIMNISEDDFPRYRAIMKAYDASRKRETSQECVEDSARTNKVRKVRLLPRCLRFDESSKVRRDFIAEMRLLSRLRHPCITTVMGAVISSSIDPMLVMEVRMVVVPYVSLVRLF